MTINQWGPTHSGKVKILSESYCCRLPVWYLPNQLTCLAGLCSVVRYAVKLISFTNPLLSEHKQVFMKFGGFLSFIGFLVGVYSVLRMRIRNILASKYLLLLQKNNLNIFIWKITGLTSGFSLYTLLAQEYIKLRSKVSTALLWKTHLVLSSNLDTKFRLCKVLFVL